MIDAKDKSSAHPQQPSISASAPVPSPVQQSSGDEQQQRERQSAVLAQCLKLLSGNSDEHKFAGLVMVTKHMPALTGSGTGASCNGKLLRQICNAVGPNFVHRLLRTAGDGGGNGGDERKVVGTTRGLSVYQQIALGVLAAFLREESLVECFVPIGPALVRTIRAVDAVKETQALNDALDCAQALAGSVRGMERLLRAGAAAAIVSRLTASSAERTSRSRENANSSRGGEAGVEETKGSTGDARPEEFFLTPAGLGADTSWGEGCNRGVGTSPRAEAAALAFLGRALEASAGNCLGARELTSIAEAFRDDPTPAKFVLMDLLLRWAVMQEDCRDAPGPILEARAVSLGAWTKRGPFPAALREGLLQALHGAAKDKHRDSALAILASLLRALGQEWAVEEEVEAIGGMKRAQSRSDASRSNGRERGTFVAFAMRCASGEVRILLDECLSILLPGSSAAIGDDETEKGSTFHERARGPMGPAGVDPSIGAAAELAAAAASSDDAHKVEQKVNSGYVSSSARGPLCSAEHKAVKEERAARLMRMVPVGLGIAEAAIAFLCGGTGDEGSENHIGNDDGDAEWSAGSGRWEELPVETLQDLQKTLFGLFDCVFDFLSEIQPWIVPRSDKVPSPSPVDLWAVRRIGLACSRAVGIWVAEDPESLPQRFVDALPVLLALKAGAEAPDSDDEESEDDDEEDAVAPTVPSLAAFPGAAHYVGTPLSRGLGTAVGPDEALHNILRAMLALSYEPAPLAAMVEEGVTARLSRLASSGPQAIAALLAAGATAVPPLPPPEQASEAVRSPLVTACGLLTNILTSAGHLAWPESGCAGRGTVACGGKKGRPSIPRAPSHPVLTHPEMGECLASLAEVAGMAGAARRAGGGARWRLLAAHATLVVMVVARTASSAAGSGLAPRRDLADRRPRWSAEGDNGSCGPSVWGIMARAVDEALGSLSAMPGRGVIGAMDGEEASYEEGAIWQWCLECAREIEAASGGAEENPFVAVGMVPLRVLRSLEEASSDGRI